MSCAACLAITDDLFLCSKQHLLCQDCILLIIDSQCPKCQSLKENELTDLTSSSGTIPKISMSTNRLYQNDELRQQLRHKYCLDISDPSQTESSIKPLDINCKTINADVWCPQVDTNTQNRLTSKTGTGLRDEAIRRSELLLQEQIMSQVFSNWNKTEKSEISEFNDGNNNEDYRPGEPEQRMNLRQTIRLKCESQPNPVKTESCRPFMSTSKSTRDYARSQTYFTPTTVVPEFPTYSLCYTALGQGDESMQTPIMDSQPLDRTEDLPTEKFMQFIFEKFPNMSLTEIKNLLTEMPVPKIQYKPLKPGSEWCATEAEQSLNLVDGPVVPKETGSFTAYRALILNELSASGEPAMQSSPIEPFEDSDCKIKPAHSIPATFDLEMPRNPVVCPITECNNTQVFVSDFTRHVKMNHVRVPVEVLHPQVGCNFFVDPTLDQVGRNRCRMLFLVSDKVKNLGRTSYKNVLPVMVMTTLLHVDNILPYKMSDNKVSGQCFFLIWLTGLCPNPTPINLTTCIWKRCHKNQPDLHRVQSGRLYCIRKPQTGADVFRSGHALALTTEQCEAVTSGGTSMLKVQVMVH